MTTTIYSEFILLPTPRIEEGETWTHADVCSYYSPGNRKYSISVHLANKSAVGGYCVHMAWDSYDINCYVHQVARRSKKHDELVKKALESNLERIISLYSEGKDNEVKGLISGMVVD